VSAPRTIRAGRLLRAPGHGAGEGASAIHIADGRIAAIEAIDPATLTAEEAGLLVLPAPADAHDHGRGLRTLAYGAADAPLEEWLPALARQPWIDPYTCAALAFARMAQGGICAANHCHNTQDGTQLLAEAEATSRAARDVGIRIAFAMPFQDRNPAVYGDLDRLLASLPDEDRPGVIARAKAMRSLETNRTLIEAIGALEHETFTLQYGPVAPQWVTHETLAAIAAASAETGRRVHMHLLETERQREWADAHYPGGLIPYLDSIGMLSPRLAVAHAVWLRPDECALLAERGVTVSINLSSNLRLRSGRPPLAAIRAAGLAFGIGLDGMSFDDDEDMLRELRLVWHVHARDRDAMSAAELFDAACRAGRRTITGDEGGRIVPGAPADLLALDFAAMTADCVHDDIDPVDILLGRMAARHVRRLTVAGRDIVIDGRCVTVDAPALEAGITAAGRAAFLAARPDGAAIGRMQNAVRSFHAAGHHRCGPDTGSR
jgi:cytosine/adenosine deaminase-related metal-dependent hydrolase